jgi:myo-inositol-1(or 4)-monophosphatase
MRDKKYMTLTEQKQALQSAVKAVRAAGQIMRRHLRSTTKQINEATQHDLKLELDVRCQTQIQKVLSHAYPHVAMLGEEGTAGDQQQPCRWVVDPIDGTVNFAYGIPHACASIALQMRNADCGLRNSDAGQCHGPHAQRYRTLVGAVYDPFCDELWTAIRGQPARLNGRIIHASRRTRLDEAIVALGFSKNAATLRRLQPIFIRLLHRVRKLRIMGAGALDLVYVACGRFDAYLEPNVRLWDIAAGGLILECAGGEFWRVPLAGEHVYRVLAHNGFLRAQLEEFG